MVPGRAHKAFRRAAIVCGLLATALAATAAPAGSGGAAAATEPGARLEFAGLQARAWNAPLVRRAARLVVILHGDLAGPGDTYQHRAAANAAARMPDTVVVALLRPGYGDGVVRSPGRRGLATGDNYTPAVVGALARAVRAAKARFGAGEVTLVGHSGGAVLAADVAEADPTLASRLLLVSCPCDVASWRRRTALRRLNPAWLLPTTLVSPLDGARRLGPGTLVRMVSGREDDVAPFTLAQALVRTLSDAGTPARLRVLAGAGHDILLDPRVLDELVALQSASPEPRGRQGGR